MGGAVTPEGIQTTDLINPTGQEDEDMLQAIVDTDSDIAIVGWDGRQTPVWVGQKEYSDSQTKAIDAFTPSLYENLNDIRQLYALAVGDLVS